MFVNNNLYTQFKKITKKILNNIMKKILITLNPPKNLKSIGGGNYFVQKLTT